jgi:hypothetical protein
LIIRLTDLGEPNARIAEARNALAQSLQQRLSRIVERQQKVCANRRVLDHFDKLLFELLEAGSAERRTQVLLEAIEDEDKVRPERLLPRFKACCQ